jgi:hypothetical protein
MLSHPGRGGMPTPHRIGIQIGEITIREHRLTVISEQSVQRALAQPVPQDLTGILETR